MKVPELYISDLALALRCLKFNHDFISDRILKDIARSKRQAFLRPWAKRHILMAGAIRAQAGMQLLIEMKELQDKLLMSTGQDEDMRPVTLKEILKIKDD